tara:strand:- start:1470 stop:2099 length:630 start_codon:yes stop_codon:yes gene_type:complete
MTLEEKKEKKRLYDIEYRKKNKKKLDKQHKDWVKNNPDKVRVIKNKYKGKKKITDKLYAKNNKGKLNKQKKIWAKNNPKKVSQAKLKWVNNKLETDPLFKIKHYIRCGINQSFKRNGYSKKSKSYEILGCSYEEFKKHIESQWESWMNWDNYGNPKDGILEPYKTWDLDHIIPSSSAINENDVIKLNHYSNFQPLCSYVNRLIKKDKKR